MVLISLLFCFLPLILFGKNKESKRIEPPREAWEQVAPYLMSDTHPLKQTLDDLFSQTRIIRDRESLLKAGFENPKPQPVTGVVVTRHPQMPGYVFKIYTDDRMTYYRNQPEYTTWMRRARGAALVRHEIARQGWQAYFKAPIKWIYALPPKPKASPGHLQKNFILVEEDMEILPNRESKKKWQDGTITPKHLRMLFHLLTTLGMADSCKYSNIPVCKDGRIAFVDTQSNLRWPLHYSILDRVLSKELSAVLHELMEENNKLERAQKQRR
jgi:hypothetical protein